MVVVVLNAELARSGRTRTGDEDGGKPMEAQGDKRAKFNSFGDTGRTDSPHVCTVERK